MTLVPPGLEIEAVSHRYAGGIVALDDVSLAVQPGEVVCLLGPSGCGKSTLLRVAAGLESLQAGVVRVRGEVVAGNGRSVPPEKRGVGMLFQDYALFPHLTVLENASFGLTRLAREARRARALECLTSLGVADLAARHPHTLSGGQQQRAALARALAPRPAVMLLDEPFSGLDTRLREQVREDALRALKVEGAATLLVTHDPHEAMAMGDRVAIMRAGRILQVGTPADVYVAPVSTFVAAFLGEVNRFVGAVQAGRVATPLGPVDAAGLAEGQAVEVVVRPEWVRLTPSAADGALPAEVRRARLLGSQTELDVALVNGDGSSWPLRVLHGGQTRLAPGERVGVCLEPGAALVFPRNEDGAAGIGTPGTMEPAR